MIGQFGPFEFPLSERYRFEAELGRGAMGTVYRAKDVRLGRPVAIKVLHPTLTNELGSARFQSEIRIAAGLHHPNIIGVHDSGEADGRLFYVMDYLGGETLRDRLKREKQLSVEEALRITEQVAEGLQYAHEHSVVHRDVKPENILLAEGKASVMDFGLARALGDVGAERLTASGLSVGTPHYLSPEQASAEKDVGPAADQYALACVLYEMLAGEPPFTGPTASAVAMRHITEEPRPLRPRRKTTSVIVEAAVMRALEKVPADRFASVKEFVEALRSTVFIPLRTRTEELLARARSKPVKPLTIVGVLLTVIVLVAGMVIARSESSAADAMDDALRWVTNRQLDTNRYALMLVGTGADPALDEQLHRAFARWTGITVPSRAELRSAVDSFPTNPVSLARASVIARAVRAGRYVMMEVTSESGTKLVRGEAFDTRTLRSRGSETVVLGAGIAPDAALAHLVYALLFDGDEASKNEDAAAGTSSRPALERFLRGRVAGRTWNLIAADSAYSQALRFDPDFPQALLALAQTRSWMRDDAADVVGLVSRALDRARLLGNDRLQGIALRELASGRFREACEQFRSLALRDSLAFASWWGLAECNRRDRIVVRNSVSRSGRSFRGSLHRSSVAIGRAFDLLSGIDPCCAARAADLQRRTLVMKATRIIPGIGAPPDTAKYGAYPELIADTLALVPVHIGEINQAPPRTHALAIDHQRRAFLAIASRRATQSPHSADALEQLAEALDLNHRAAALDTLRRARAVATLHSQALRLAATEVWLRVRVALPNNLLELGAVRRLADSLLAHAPPATSNDAVVLASLAALLGDAPAAARISKHIEPAGAAADLPVDVQGEAWALLTYAAMGGPVDSLKALETRVSNEIANGVVPDKQAGLREMSIGRAAVLAFPIYRSPTLPELAGPSLPMASAEVAFARTDRRAARAQLDRIRAQRSYIRAADLTIDALYPQAWLYAALGDTAMALRTIGETLDALPSIPARDLADVVIAGSLIRSMRLRGELLRHRGDAPSAAAWLRAAAALTRHDSTTAPPR